MFDLRNYAYMGVMKAGVGKVYSLSPYRDYRLYVKTFRVGESIGEIFEFATSLDEDYVSARTWAGWVSVWCATNNAGQRRGVYFVELTASRRLVPYEVKAVPDDYFAPPGCHVWATLRLT